MKHFSFCQNGNIVFDFNLNVAILSKAIFSSAFIAAWLLINNYAFAQNSTKEMRELEIKVLFCQGETTNTSKLRRTATEKVTKKTFSEDGLLSFYEKIDGTIYVDVIVPGASIAELSYEMLFRTTSESIRGTISNANDFREPSISFKMNRHSGEFETVRWYSNVYGSNEEISKGICDLKKNNPPLPHRF